MSNEKKDIEQMLLDGKTVEIYPQGYSMYPLVIPGRDRVVIAPFVRQRDRIRRGDVLLFRRKGSILVLHRVCDVDKKGAYFVGDNQKQVEGPVEPSLILGRAVAFVRKGRRISTARPSYQMLTGLWLLLRPIRPMFWAITKQTRRLFGRKQS